MTDQNKQKEIEKLKQFIASAEKSLEEAKRSLFNLTGENISNTGPRGPSKDSLENLKTYEAGKIIEGIFDGENMVGPDGKIFPVPANYASKSKLVEGDNLKLTVAEDGSFIFKQIGPVERKKIIGTLGFENNVYHVLAEGKVYNVLYASVTYFKAKAGDRVTIVVPEKEDTTWAALENIIHDVSQVTGGQNKESEVKMSENTQGDNAGPLASDNTNPADENQEGTPQIVKEDSGLIPDGASGAAPGGTEDFKDGREALPAGHFLPLDGTDDNEQNAVGERVSEAPKDLDLEI